MPRSRRNSPTDNYFILCESAGNVRTAERRRCTHGIPVNAATELHEAVGELKEAVDESQEIGMPKEHIRKALRGIPKNLQDSLLAA